MRRHSRHFNLYKRFTNAFTIVELLVVVVIIAVLAAISLVIYSGISQKAIASVLQSDLSNAATAIKAFQVEKGNFPATISTDCSASPDSATNKCIKLSSGNSIVGYSYNNLSSPKNFLLIVKNGTNTYEVTDKTSPTQLANTTQPGVTPGATLELHGAKANGGASQGINIPLTTTWADTSGDGNNGTLTNFGAQTPWSGVGTVANPYQLALDGTDDRVTIPAAVAPRYADFSVEAWVKTPSGVASNYGTVLAYGSWNVPNHYGLWNSNANDQLRLSINRNDFASNLGAMVTLGYDTWRHVVGTFDRDGNLVTYLDGSPTGSPVAISTLSDVDYSSGPEIGYYSGWYMQQSIAVARFYPFVLTPTQVTANYNAGVDW